MKFLAMAMLTWTAIAVPQSDGKPAPLRAGWLVQSLPEGGELRYLPLAVTLKDYPKVARKAGEERTSLLSLQVGTSGKLLSCTTARSSGSDLLDEHACRLYSKRGRFELRGSDEAVTVQAPVKWVLVD